MAAAADLLPWVARSSCWNVGEVEESLSTVRDWGCMQQYLDKHKRVCTPLSLILSNHPPATVYVCRQRHAQLIMENNATEWFLSTSSLQGIGGVGNSLAVISDLLRGRFHEQYKRGTKTSWTFCMYKGKWNKSYATGLVMQTSAFFLWFSEETCHLKKL